MKANFIFLALLASFAGFASSKASDCPSVGIASRTGGSTAAEFASSKNYSLDEAGILTWDYGDNYNGLGKFRNPYFISIYANLLYKDYLDTNCTDASLKDKFLLQANWYIESAELRNGVAAWGYPFVNKYFDLAPGWISGIGQARIAGVLQRAYALTGDAKYRDYAEMAMRVYEVAPSMGGVATKEGNVTWFEEIPSVEESHKILNGHITALAGILDYYKISQDVRWLEVYNRGIAAVKRDVGKFDAGYLTYYSLSSPKFRRMAAKRGYNSLHAHQLLWLFEETKDHLFLEYASRFQFYEIAPLTFAAKGSVDPKGHGPDQANGLYGSRYWSHADFPTWLEVNTKEPASFSGVALHSTREQSAPQDFTIFARVDGEWEAVANVKGNKEFRQTVIFAEPVQADAFRIEVQRDNGNKNVTVQAFLPIWSDPQFAAITNECNYRARNGHYNYDLALDDDRTTSMKVLCPGWIIVPAEKVRNVILDAEGAAEAHFTIEQSDDLSTWRAIGESSLKGSFRLDSPASFLRISFGADVSSISSLDTE